MITQGAADDFTPSRFLSEGAEASLRTKMPTVLAKMTNRKVCDYYKRLRDLVLRQADEMQAACLCMRIVQAELAERFYGFIDRNDPVPRPPRRR